MDILKLILLVAIASGCANQKRCTKKFPQVARVDSVYIEKLKEIKVQIPGDTIEIIMPIQDCPDQELYSVENTKLKQQVRILNGKLIANTQIKPDTVLKYVTETVVQYKEVKIPQVIKETPRFWRVMGLVGIGAIFMVIAFTALKMRNLGSFLKKLVS